MRNLQSRPAQGRRDIVIGTLMAGLLLASPTAFAQNPPPAAGAPAQQPPTSAPGQQPGQPPGQAAPAQPSGQPSPGLTFEGDAGLILMQIKPDKTADFESVMAKLHDALLKTDKPERKQQAAGWRIYKSTDPGPGGNVLYVAVVNPALKGADYTVAKILYEVFPTEVQTIFPTYRDSFAAGLKKLNLSLVQDFSKGASAQSTSPTSAQDPAQQK
jgi:hypothetical protein